MSRPMPGDLGVIGYFTKTAVETDIKNLSGVITPIAIDNTKFQATASIGMGHVGQDATVTLAGVLGVGQSVKVRLETQALDSQNATAWNFASITCTRGDSIAGAAVEQTILPADLTDAAGLNAGKQQDVVLQTTSQRGCGVMRVIAKFAIAPAVGDKIIIRVNQ